jgi:hypothetical protein
MGNDSVGAAHGAGYSHSITFISAAAGLIRLTARGLPGWKNVFDASCR